MNLALLFQSGLLSSLHELKQRWNPYRSSAKRVAPASPCTEPARTPILIARCATPTWGDAHKFTLRRPLRVVRILEVGQPQSSVGRMVISGRMADVCAELDRLAARETALS